MAEFFLKFFKEEWDKISAQQLKRAIAHYHKHLPAIVATKNGTIHL